LPLIGAYEQRPVAHTPFGTVRGFWVNGTNVWRGVPYAAPPVGDLRFRPPQLPKTINGILDTVRFSASCPQIGSQGTATSPGWPSINVTISDEDCLYVNIYAAEQATISHPLPVIVYFHAGEFRFGSSNDLENDWPRFAEGQAIVVTANVRLGLLGFAALDGLRSRDPTGSSGNYGMQDQRAVLSWVRKSISSFGGDIEKVTIMGESSGGTSVAFHLTSQASQGLFSQVIMQSPGLTQSKPWNHTVQNTEFAVSMLTGAGSEGCTWPAETQWLHFPGLTAKGVVGPLGVAHNSDALKRCANRADCAVVFRQASSNTSYLFGGGTPGQIASTSMVTLANDSLRLGSTLEFDVFVKAPNPNTSISCLLKASVADLVAVVENPPHGDTVQTDALAPTVDGVELKAPLGAISVSAVPPNVAVLAGSNLDEGTMFMYMAPKISCNATEHEFSEWAVKMYGLERGKKLLPLYETLQAPSPLCDQDSLMNPTSIHYTAAMRSTGDSVIVCPVRELLRSAQKQGTSKLWWYQFTHTPLYSVNMPAYVNGLYGAFHGAEVPFVFGDGFELESDAERLLSKAMGCYWINFAATGNPNKGPSNCFEKLSLLDWRAFDQDNLLELSTEGLRNRPSFQKDRCDVFKGLHSHGEVMPQHAFFV